MRYTWIGEAKNIAVIEGKKMLRGGCVGKRRRWGAEEQRQELGARAAVARLDGLEN